MRRLLLVGAATVVLGISPAQSETFRFAFQGDVQSLDPHGLNETFTLGFLGNIYEGLTHYDRELRVQAGLAASWENIDPTTWRVNLRKDVKFHNGNDFDADDVVFSWQRSLTAGSAMKGYGAKIAEIRVIDPYTIDIVTPTPNPVLPRELVYLYIMNKAWSEENEATEATSPKVADAESTYAALNANGTGPFRLVERKAEVRSVMKRFDGYWGKIASNVTDVVFTPISDGPARVAALTAGEVDLAWPIPMQDWKRLEEADGVSPLTGPEARTIFLGMDQHRDELLHSSVKGVNPLKDRLVRAALAHAIDLNLLNDTIMEGAATPAGLLIGPQVNGFNAALNKPYYHDLEMAQSLLAEAGYPEGFELGMDCPNNRYVNDARICQGVAEMLGRVGIKVDLNVLPKSQYFDKISPQNGNDTSFYLLGWTPSTMDAHNAFFNLVSAFDAENQSGQFNYGRYSNPAIDALTDKIVSETDADERQSMIDAAMTLLKEDVGYLPIHQQPLSWGVRDGVTVAQRADDVVDLRDVVVRTPP